MTDPITLPASSGAGSLAQRQRTKKKKTILKRILWTVVILAVLAGAAFGVYMLFFREAPRTPITGRTVYGALDRSIEGSGTTVPAETLAVTAVSRARIEDVYVKAGDTVTKGQLLYTQDDSEVDSKIAGYETEIAGCEDEIVEYEASIAEQQAIISDYQGKIAEYNASIRELNQMRSSLNITAPFGGSITKVSAEAGKNVNSGSVLAQLTDESVMTLTQYFSYAYAEQVYVGMPAVVTVADQLLTLSGSVSAISWVERTSNEGMKCFGVTVEFPNPGSLQESSSAQCFLISDTQQRLYPTLDGKITYKSSVSVTAGASGELLSVHVQEYDRVSAGQLLFVIDSESYDTQLENLEKQITTAEKQITTAEKQIESFEKKIESTNEKIGTARDSIAEAEESREKYAMRSEIAGKVMYCNIKPGDTPNTMTSVITIYNMDTMNISVNFDELDVDYIAEGTPVTVTRTSAERTYYYSGRITYLSPEATSSGGVATFAATIEIASRGALSSGVSVSYKISLGDSEEGVLAPVAALKSHEDQYYLYVKADERPENAVDLVNPSVEVPAGFYAVPVEVGSSNAQYVRILSGVDRNTEVFTRYQQTAPANKGTSDTPEEEETSGGFSGMPNMGGSGGNFQRPSGGSSWQGGGSSGNSSGGSWQGGSSSGGISGGGNSRG